MKYSVISSRVSCTWPATVGSSTASGAYCAATAAGPRVSSAPFQRSNSAMTSSAVGTFPVLSWPTAWPVPHAVSARTPAAVKMAAHMWFLRSWCHSIE